MKTQYLLVLMCLLHVAVHAQDARYETNRLNWQTFKATTAEELISTEKQKLGLAESDALELRSRKVDDLMIEHTRYNQTHKGVAIDGSQYVLHSSNGKIWGNGRLVYGITANETPDINEATALENALTWFGDKSYLWEDSAQETLIKWLKNDPGASYYPQGKLVFADKEFSQNGADYHLYWKFDIHSNGERMREYVYVNALTGAVDHSKDAICYGSAQGTADTYYYGQQTIITDSLSPNLFRLADTTRGGGIYTMDLQLTPPSYGAGIEIFDNDNDWTAADKAGPTAHWCAEMTYDYYLDKYNRNSFDDNGAKMLTYVHLGVNGNCFGVGFFSGQYAAIGDGPGCNNPGYYLEHIGHEYTHGVLAFSSALQGGERARELAESFCNIMGTAIEFYADPINATWEFKATVPYDMSDPNASPSPFQKPDTYLGNYWVEVGDPGYDVHINAGVQDYWYYLLCEGGSGINDNGDAYAVQGIGMDDATDIVYRNLTLYLVPSTTYMDARQGSIQAAIDLYGACSNEVVQVLNAWYAVGLGPDVYSDDLSFERIVSPAKNCDLTNSEIVEVELKYNSTGCNGTLQAGTSVDLTYQVDNDPPVSETWTVVAPLQEGDSYIFSFATPISIPAIGNVIELSVWLDYSMDGIPFNDSIIDFEIGLKQALTDTVITFESGTDPESYYYVHTGEVAVATIDTVAANTGLNGFRLSSGTGAPGVISSDTTQNFETQKERVSKICFCVDAQQWSYVTVNFDMKQTRSMLYNHFWGTDTAEYASSMRILVNGAQFGSQFHPATYFNDPYQTHVYSLDQLGLAGTQFEFCFQSINSVNDVGVPNPLLPFSSVGDNTYLDNIWFSGLQTSLVNEITELQLEVSPNPTDAFITIMGDLPGATLYEIYSMLGQQVMNGIIAQGNNRIDLSELAPNIYILKIGQGSYKILKTD